MNGSVVGVDASRSTADQPTGTENYAREILRHLLRLPEAADIEWRLYCRAATDLLPPELTGRPNVVPAPLPNRRMWTHRSLGPEVRRRRPDVLFVPAHVLPFAWTAPEHAGPGHDHPRPRLPPLSQGPSLAAARLPEPDYALGRGPGRSA